MPCNQMNLRNNHMGPIVGSRVMRHCAGQWCGVGIAPERVAHVMCPAPHEQLPTGACGCTVPPVVSCSPAHTPARRVSHGCGVIRRHAHCRTILRRQTSWPCCAVTAQAPCSLTRRMHQCRDILGIPALRRTRGLRDLRTGTTCAMSGHAARAHEWHMHVPRLANPAAARDVVTLATALVRNDAHARTHCRAADVEANMVQPGCVRARSDGTGTGSGSRAWSNVICIVFVNGPLIRTAKGAGPFPVSARVYEVGAPSCCHRASYGPRRSRAGASAAAGQ